MRLPALAEMIEADHHASLIASGNLHREAVQREASNTWTSQGYSARTLSQLCECCGSTQTHCVGIFHDEVNALGHLRSQRLDPRAQFLSLKEILPMAPPEKVSFCADCLRTLFLS